MDAHLGALVRSADSDAIEAEADYAPFRTRQNELSEVFNVGRYVDVVRRTADGLRFASRICAFDSEMIPSRSSIRFGAG